MIGCEGVKIEVVWFDDFDKEGMSEKKLFKVFFIM